VLILGVTNLYLVYDQQFPFYFASLFPTPARGNEMFGYLSSAHFLIAAVALLFWIASWFSLGATPATDASGRPLTRGALL
jgi:OHS family lactose permease-like MFS transporter